MTEETWIAGPEYDDAIFKKLGLALKACGFTLGSKWNGHAGSQEVSHWELSNAKGSVVIESETYIGLSVKGKQTIVQEIKTAFEAETC